MWEIYLVEGVVVGVEEGWAHMMACVPSSLANFLMFTARGYASISRSAPHRCDLAVYVWANSRVEVPADALPLCGRFSGRAASVCNDWGSLGLVDDHEGIFLRGGTSHQHLLQIK